MNANTLPLNDVHVRGVGVAVEDGRRHASHEIGTVVERVLMEEPEPLDLDRSWTWQASKQAGRQPRADVKVIR